MEDTNNMGHVDFPPRAGASGRPFLRPNTKHAYAEALYPALQPKLRVCTPPCILS